MSETSWWQRNGAVFTLVIALIALMTYLHVSLGSLRAEIGSLRTEVRTETGSLRTEVRTEIGSLRVELREGLREVRESLDRVETKVDEVRRYLGFNAASPPRELPPANLPK